VRSLKVLSIIGYTRSGSTLLDSVLGQLDGFFSTGELHYLWERGLLEARRCGCGEPLPECPVWTAALAAGFGDGVPDPLQVGRWQDRSVRSRHTLPLLRGGRGPGIDEAALARYREVAGALYRGIADATGARVIVDSSKRPSDGALTRLLPDVDPYFVQLVRDPRAVVYSWRRVKRELDTDAGDATMPRQGRVASAFGWTELNALSDLVRWRAGRERSLLVRYDDFVAHPRETVAAIGRLVGEPLGDLPFDGDHDLRMAPTHTVSGNPARFSTGTVTLRPDQEWLTAMPGTDRWLTTALTLPLLPRYRFPIVPRRPV